MRVRLIAIATILLLTTGRAPTATAETPVIAGWVERISMPVQSLVFEAKLDTGADSSSLNGRNIERFRQVGQSMVRFELIDDSGKTVKIEAPVVRRVKVRRAGNEGDSRAVVRLNVCVGGQVGRRIHSRGSR